MTQLNAKHLADASKMISESLEGAAIQAHIRLEEGEGLSFLNIFKAGVEWMKAKIMKGAVDVHVVRSYNPITEKGKPTLHGVELLYKDETNSYLVAGEDARIIIIKNNNK